MKNLDEILNVAGIDGVFIGPSDLAADMGLLGQAEHPEVKKSIANALQRIRKAGKIAGIMALNKPLADFYASHGANMIAISIDTLLLAHAAKKKI